MRPLFVCRSVESVQGQLSLAYHFSVWFEKNGTIRNSEVDRDQHVWIARFLPKERIESVMRTLVDNPVLHESKVVGPRSLVALRNRLCPDGRRMNFPKAPCSGPSRREGSLARMTPCRKERRVVLLAGSSGGIFNNTD